MNRGTLVYIAMFVLLGAGTWTVLALGAGAEATPDVSGTWEVRPAETRLPFVGDAFELEQSGKYVRLRTSAGARADVKLVGSAGHHADAGSRGAMPQLRFAGDGVELTLVGLPDTHRVQVRVAGPASLTFEARRVVYQGKPVNQDGTVPPATAPTPNPR